MENIHKSYVPRQASQIIIGNWDESMLTPVVISCGLYDPFASGNVNLSERENFAILYL